MASPLSDPDRDPFGDLPTTAVATIAGRTPAPLVPLEILGEQARAYVEEAHAANTRRAYRADWQAFTSWCELRRLVALPTAPTTLALYLVDQAEVLKVSTLQRRLAGIAQAHRLAGHASPLDDGRVKAVWRGIRRAEGTAQVGKAALLTDDVKAMVAALPTDTRIGVRDRALLRLGFAGAFRRSELVGLDVDDVQLLASGAIVTVRRSKTDQEGEGQKVGVPRGRHPSTCPVRAPDAWLELAGIADGPIFRPITRHGAIEAGRLTDRSVARIIQRSAASAGLDPAF